MGLFGKIFGSKNSKRTSGELFKEATRLKKTGDWDGAIQSLKQAYKKARSEGVSYGTDVYLRLPKYLYEAGRPDEAWSVYNRALTEGLDGQNKSKEMAEVNQSQIYGSMAGQLKKEKKFYEAAIYQGASALSWGKGMLVQKRDSEHDLDSIQKAIEQTLKKSDYKEVHEKFIVFVREAVANPKSHNVVGLITQLRGLTKR